MQRSQAIRFACPSQLAAACSSSSRTRLSWLYPWQGRALSSSASADHEKDDPISAHDFLPPLEEPDLAHASNKRSNGQKGRPSSGASHEARFHKSQGKGIMKNDQDQAESIGVFQNIVKQQAHEDGSHTTLRDRPPDQIEFLQNLDRLKPMMREESLDRCFQFFLDRVWSKKEYRKSGLLKSQGTSLLHKVAAGKSKDMYNGNWPSVAQIAQIALELRSFNTRQVSNMVMALIESIVSISSERADFPSEEAHQNSLAKKQELLEDLVETWIVFHRNGLNPDFSSLRTSQEAQFRLPQINGTRLQFLAKRGRFFEALNLVFSETVHMIHRDVHAAVLATFVLLTDPTHSNTSVRQKAKPLLVSVGRVLAAVQIHNSALANIFESHPQILLYVMKSWSSLISQLHRLSPLPTSPAENLDDHIINGKFGESVAVDPNLYHQRLSSALLMGDAQSVEDTWVQYWGESGALDQERAINMRRHAKLFNSFIGAFTALHRSHRALDVWEAMTSVGIEATLDTWSAMIDGFKKARNPVGLEGVWKKLVASGMQLDQNVWRARISGLMYCGEPRAALQALKELAQGSKKPGGVPLTIESVNAVIAGLIRHGAMSATTEVLHWASQYGIKPDVFTYNHLLRPLLRDGQTAQVQKLLHLMRDQGVEPDAATFTSLLDNVIIAGRDKTPEQLTTMLRQYIDNMEKAGVYMNIDILGRMIHLLTREEKLTIHHTEGVVGALLKYAEKKGLRLSRHIYTILVDYYFSRDPPAIEAANELLMDPKGLVLSATGGLDRVFWERVIGGFASAGDADRALGLFEQVSSLGTALTLDCLESLLCCLISQGKMTEARKLVVKVANDRRNLEEQREVSVSRNRVWRHGFWGVAHDHGLLSSAEWGPSAKGQKKTAASPVPDTVTK